MWLLEQADAVAVLPEIILAVLSMALLMFGVFRKDDPADAVTISALVALGLAAIFVIWGGAGTVTAFNGAFVVDTFARLMKVLALFGSAVAIVLSVHFMKRDGSQRFEFPILILLATIGMMMMISANNLIALYMGLELQSLSLYVLAAINRDSARASEAGLKYFVLGALSSGMLLYGSSLVYGFTGSTAFPQIAESLAAHGAGLGLIFGLVFIIAGLAFKISAVPFHMWTPDVYEGAPTPVTAFFASAPKMAAMALMVRVIITAFPGVLLQWQQIVVFIALASMALGSFAAIGQSNIKRLMAYSSIGHMGFALVGLAAGTQAGVQGVLVYMAIYLFMTLGTFAAILMMRRSGKSVETIADLAGLGMTDKGMAFFLAMMMFSLAGIPPLGGFFAKFFVFSAAVDAGLWWLVIPGVLASCVAAYYYLSIIKVMYFDSAAPAFDKAAPLVRAVLVTAALVVMLYPLYPAPLVSAALAAAKSLF